VPQTQPRELGFVNMCCSGQCCRILARQHCIILLHPHQRCCGVAGSAFYKITLAVKLSHCVALLCTLAGAVGAVRRAGGALLTRSACLSPFLLAAHRCTCAVGSDNGLPDRSHHNCAQRAFRERAGADGAVGCAGGAPLHARLDRGAAAVLRRPRSRPGPGNPVSLCMSHDPSGIASHISPHGVQQRRRGATVSPWRVGQCIWHRVCTAARGSSTMPRPLCSSPTSVSLLDAGLAR